MALLWILLRSGVSPKRLTYPCQRAAVPIAVNWILAVCAWFAGSLILQRFTKVFSIVMVVAAVSWFVVTTPSFLRSSESHDITTPVWKVADPVSLVYVLDSIPLTAGSLAAGDTSVPDQHLSDPAIDTILAMMEANGTSLYRTVEQPDGVVDADNVVVIKGNFQWTSRNTTSTDRIKGLIWRIMQHPDGFSGEIIVCDNTQNQGTGINHSDNNSEDENQSIIDVVNTFHAKGYPVYVMDWVYIWDVIAAEYSEGDYSDGYIYESDTRISYPKFRTPSGNHFVSLRYGVWDSLSIQYDSSRLCLIDMPVPKQHAMAGATVAVKNWIGVLTTAYRDRRYGGWNGMHYTYFWGSYALVARLMAVTYPRLVIVDAAWLSGTNPNVLTSLTNAQILLASTDPVAVSWYVAKYALTPVADNPSWTNPDGNMYGVTLDRWTTFMADSAGLPCTKDSSKISVYDRDIFICPDSDHDGDGVCDSVDNCPHDFNPDQADSNGDGAGDVCCCLMLTGNVDADPDDLVDLGDLTKLIDYLFISLTEPDCIEEANVDGDPGGLVDLGDLTALIDYLFITFTQPTECL